MVIRGVFRNKRHEIEAIDPQGWTQELRDGAIVLKPPTAEYPGEQTIVELRGLEWQADMRSGSQRPVGMARLRAITDTWGVRSLYWGVIGMRFALSDRFGSIIASLSGPFHLNREALAQCLTLGYCTGSRTLLEEVTRLEGASLYELQDEMALVRAEQGNVWSALVSDLEPVRGLEDIHAAIKESCARTIDHALVDRTAVSLSGGLDSRWTLAVLLEAGIRLPCLTFSGNPKAADLRIARRVSSLSQCDHHVYLYTLDDLQKGLPVHARETGGNGATLMAFYPLLAAWLKELGILGLLLTQSQDLLFGSKLEIVHLAREMVGGEFRRPLAQYVYRAHRRIAARELPRILGRTTSEIEEMSMAAFMRDFGSLDFGDLAGRDLVRRELLWNLRNRQIRWTMSSMETLRSSGIIPLVPSWSREVLRLGFRLTGWQKVEERAYARAFSKHFPVLARVPWSRVMMPVTGNLVASVFGSILRRYGGATTATWSGGYMLRPLWDSVFSSSGRVWELLGTSPPKDTSGLGDALLDRAIMLEAFLRELDVRA